MSKIVSVVLGSYNRLPMLKLTIQSVRKELEGFDHEIIVVDGGSTDGALKWLLRQKDIITIVQHNRGEWKGRPVVRRSWGYFMNLGFKAAQGKYVCMISDDCLVVPSAIRNGIKRAEEERAKGINVGAVAFYYRDYPKYKKYRVQLTLGGKMFVNHGLYLNDALRSVNYADEDNYSFYHADGDLCLRMWHNGYLVIDSPDSFIEHHAHADLAVRASNNESQCRDFQRYQELWTNIFYDPASGQLDGKIEQEWSDNDATVQAFQQLKVHDTVSNGIHLVDQVLSELDQRNMKLDELVKKGLGAFRKRRQKDQTR